MTIAHDAATIDGRGSSGVWGAVAGSAVFAVVLAYFLYAHLYLSATADQWPPQGSPDLPLLRPAMVVGLVLAVAVLAVRIGRPLAASDDQLPRAAQLAVTTSLGLVALVAGADLVGDLGLVATERAHDASVLTLHAIGGAAAATGVVISALAAYEAGRLGNHPWVAAATVVTSIWWSTVALAWVAIATVVYVWPQLS